MSVDRPPPGRVRDQGITRVDDPWVQVELVGRTGLGLDADRELRLREDDEARAVRRDLDRRGTGPVEDGRRLAELCEAVVPGRRGDVDELTGRDVVVVAAVHRARAQL